MAVTVRDNHNTLLNYLYQVVLRQLKYLSNKRKRFEHQFPVLEIPARRIIRGDTSIILLEHKISSVPRKGYLIQ